MGYKIETISVYEVFETPCACPLCALKDKLASDYVEYYLENAAMLPEMRVQVNKYGFCGRHLDMLYAAGNRLPLALQLHTLLLEHNKRAQKAAKSYLGSSARSVKAAQSALKELDEIVNINQKECLICKSIEQNMNRYTETLVRLYFDESRFRVLYEQCSGFCWRHLIELMKAAQQVCSAYEHDRFAQKTLEIQRQNMDILASDIEQFTKMFDYRNRDADWGSSRTAVSRAVQKLGGDTRPDK